MPSSGNRRTTSRGLPRLALTWGRKLNGDLKGDLKGDLNGDPNGDLDALGMHQAFVPDGADFTNMAAAPLGNHLFIDFVNQNTFVAVDEEGAEAAAVTSKALPWWPVVAGAAANGASGRATRAAAPA